MKTFLQNISKTILLLNVICNLQFANAQTKIGIDIDGEAEWDNSGVSVSLSADGSTVAIGAPYNDGNGNLSGHARIYQNIAGTWTKIGADIDGESVNDYSGYSVSLSANGNIIAIGAYNNYGDHLSSGHVRIYQNIAGTWAQIGTDIDGEAGSDFFGKSISLSADGSTVAIRSSGYIENGNASGRVSVYKNVAENWAKIGVLDGESMGDEFGFSVFLSADGSILAIGAPHNAGNGNYAGQIRIYKNIAGTWTKIDNDINGEGVEDRFGCSVSLSADGSTVAIGALGNNYYTGQVQVYKNIAGTWTQIGADINGGVLDERSGWSVSLSADGAIVAIGAIGYGSARGRTRIYQNISGVWTQIGVNINGEASSDQSGWSVSLSSDGSKIAIGAPYNKGGVLLQSGQVRVYDLSYLLSSNSFVQSNFSIYPNPTSDIVNISLQENLQLEKVNIYNTLGQMIKTEKQNQINVSTLSKGSYFIEVITNQGKATKGFIVD